MHIEPPGTLDRTGWPPCLHGALGAPLQEHKINQDFARAPDIVFACRLHKDAVPMPPDTTLSQPGLSGGKPFIWSDEDRFTCMCRTLTGLAVDVASMSGNDTQRILECTR